MRPLFSILVCLSILGVVVASQASYNGNAQKRGGSSQSAASKLNIVVNYGPGAENRDDVKASVDAAIAVWKELILDDVTVTFEVDLGTTQTEAETTVERIMDMDRVELLTRYQSNLKAKGFILGDVFVLSRLKFLTENGEVLPTKVGPCKAQAKVLFPEKNYDQSNGALDGKIVLSNDSVSYDFDPSTPLESGSIDAVAVLVREMGHIFGFISEQDRQSAGSPQPDEIIPTMLDLYRLADEGKSWFGKRSLIKGNQATFKGFDSIVQSIDDGLSFSTGAVGLAATWDDKYTGLMVPTIKADELGGMQPEEIVIFFRLGWTLVLNFQPCPVALWSSSNDITVGDTITIRGYFFYELTSCVWGGIGAGLSSKATVNAELSEVTCTMPASRRSLLGVQVTSHGKASNSLPIKITGSNSREASGAIKSLAPLFALCLFVVALLM